MAGETGRSNLTLLLLSAAAALLAGLAVSWWLVRPPPSLADLPESERAEFLRLQEAAEEQVVLEQWDGAAADLQRCLSIFDRDPAVLTHLARALIGKRFALKPGEITEDEEDALVDEALAAIDRALDADPEHVPALKERFRIHHVPPLRRYDPDAALEDGKEILRVAPEDSDFSQLFGAWLLGGVRFCRARGERAAFDSAIGVEEAQRHTEAMLDSAPVGSDLYAQALRGLGVVHLYMGDFDRAVERLTKLDAQALPPDIKAQNLMDLGYAHYRLGNHREAAGCFIQSIDTKESLLGQWLLRLAYDKLGRDGDDLSPKYRFPLPPEEVDRGSPPKLRFTDIAEEMGVAKVDGAGPSAFADYDNDGDPDILAAGCDTFTALYRNDGDRFADVTIEAGLHELESGFSSNFVDYDNDGALDIFICRNGWSGAARNILLRNDGKGKFEDRSVESGLDDPGNGFVSLWADFDRDGDLDVVVANGVVQDGSTNRLYRNRGDGTFEDDTARAGLEEPRRWGTIGMAVGDYDRDGDPDIFVNGRWAAPNRLYRNKGDGTFDEVAQEAGLSAPPHNGYVALFFDYNNDAYPDILATCVARWLYVLKGYAGAVVPLGPDQLQAHVTRLYENDRDGTFTEVTYEAGLGFPYGIMAANSADLDNDGYLDLYFGTGDPDLKRLEPSLFLHNNGDGTFRNLSRFAGLDHLGKGHGISFADFDGDGDLDIYAPQGGFFHGDLWANPFYRNEAGNENHWFHLKLRGRSSNRFAVGAQVTLKSGGTLQYREVTGGIGFGSTNSYPVEFGLGERDSIDEVEIIWPSGLKQVLKSPPVDSFIEVEEHREGWRVIHTGQGV